MAAVSLDIRMSLDGYIAAPTGGWRSRGATTEIASTSGRSAATPSGESHAGR
jgi:hypothetical protein